MEEMDEAVLRKSFHGGYGMLNFLLDDISKWVLAHHEFVIYDVVIAMNESSLWNADVYYYFKQGEETWMHLKQ